MREAELNNMKTIAIYNDLCFYVVEGNKSHLDRKFVNTGISDEETREIIVITDGFTDYDGEPDAPALGLRFIDFPVHLIEPDTKVIQFGFCP